jgi:hypothetical protein
LKSRLDTFFGRSIDIFASKYAFSLAARNYNKMLIRKTWFSCQYIDEKPEMIRVSPVDTMPLRKPIGFIRRGKAVIAQ